MQRDHDEAERPHPAGEASAPLPLEPRPGLPVADVEPDRDHRQHQVQPVRHVAADRAGRQLRQPFELDQGQPGQADQDAGREHPHPQPDGDAVGPIPTRG